MDPRQKHWLGTPKPWVRPAEKTNKNPSFGDILGLIGIAAFIFYLGMLTATKLLGY